MEQNSNGDAPVTKEELKQVLKEYPTKKELKEILKKFPTKDDLSNQLNSSFEAFRLEMQYQFKLYDERWEDRFTRFANRMYTLIDPLLKETETRQQDRVLTASQIADLDRRVTKLEHK